MFDSESDVDVAVISNYHFNLAWRYGLPLPDAGVPGLVGKTFSLAKGESAATAGPEALIYTNDWSPANDNIVCISEYKNGAALVIWTGSCEDPDRYDAARAAGSFDIQCICRVRHEAR